jgi:excisionase family DNA binding protein
MSNGTPNKPDRLLLTSREASRLLAISPRKLWGMTASGQIPHVPIGRCVRYSFEDLLRWIDDRKKVGNA